MKKEKERFIFIFCIFLFLISFTIAQPPGATQVVLNLNAGLNIEPSRIGTLEQNEDFLFNFHVYFLEVTF